jgi:hypothetical protein
LLRAYPVASVYQDLMVTFQSCIVVQLYVDGENPYFITSKHCMWQHKQEERELKRIEGDIIKNQRAVRHTLRDFENGKDFSCCSGQ